MMKLASIPGTRRTLALAGRLLPLLATCLLGACAAPSDRIDRFDGAWLGNDATLISPLTSTPGQDPVSSHPRLAVVLGGGGLRGYAHIGVLQALEEAGIRPDLVVGSSVGAIIGGIYAAGASADQLWQLAESMQPGALFDIAFRGPGFVRGEALARWAGSAVRQQPIEHFPIRFAAVATDIGQALPYVITRGDAGEALRASAAIPGVFLPVHSSGHVFVDGGVVSLVPVYAARALGAKLVIAVDIYCQGEKYAVSSAASMLLRVAQVQSCALSRSEAASADVLLAPAISPAGMNDAGGRADARRLGYEAALAALPAIRARLERQSNVMP